MPLNKKAKPTHSKPVLGNIFTLAIINHFDKSTMITAENALRDVMVCKPGLQAIVSEVDCQWLLHTPGLEPN